MKLVLWIPTLVSIVVVTVKSVEALKRPNLGWHLKRMFIYTASVYLLYLALLPTIFALSNFIAGSGWVSTHTLEIHLAVIASFLFLFSFVWRRLRREEGRVGLGTIRKLKNVIRKTSRRSKQAAENYERANERINNLEKRNREKYERINERIDEAETEFQNLVEEIMDRLEGVSRETGSKAVVKDSPGGEGHDGGRDNRDKLGPRGTDGGKGWKEFAEQHGWIELAEEYRKRKEAERPPKELAEVLRALKERGCKFGPNKVKGHLYLQIRKYEDNERKSKTVGRVTEDVKKALGLVGAEF